MSEAFEEFYINLIKKAEKKAIKCGEGNSKTGYTLDGHVILKSRKAPVEPAENIKRYIALKNYGVNIALPKFFTSQDKVEKEGNRLIFYEVQEEAKGSFVNVSREESLYSHIIAFNPSLRKQLINQKKLAKNYNVEMTKHRAKTHLPHLNNFLNDYLTLCAFHNGDMHSENVYYSSTNGYTFFDLSPFMQINPDKDIASQIINVSDGGETIDSQTTLNRFLQDCYGLICPIDVSKHSSENFTQFVYNGILAHQLNETVRANIPENPCYNPHFPNTRNFAYTLENSKCLRENYFSMPPMMLLTLEQGLLNNNEDSLNLVRDEYNLGKHFDFSCIDISNFLETMKITHEFDYPNPTNTQTSTSSIDHIKVDRNIHGTEFEFV